MCKNFVLSKHSMSSQTISFIFYNQYYISIATEKYFEKSRYSEILNNHEVVTIKLWMQVYLKILYLFNTIHNTADIRKGIISTSPTLIVEYSRETNISISGTTSTDNILIFNRTDFKSLQSVQKQSTYRTRRIEKNILITVNNFFSHPATKYLLQHYIDVTNLIWS